MDYRVKIHLEIKAIIAEKRAKGDVLPYALSGEIARRLNMGLYQVEEIAKQIEGIHQGRAINETYYYE